MKSPGRYELALVALTAFALATGAIGAARTQHPPAQTAQSASKNPSGWTAPDPASIPNGPLGDSIRLGLNIFRDTPRYASKYVGNKLRCSDCHLQNGTAAYSSPMIGLPGLFPMYRERSGRVVTFADRINECMTRSENGRPFPSRSPELIGLIAYIQWLSQGWPTGKPFPTRGLIKLPALKGDPDSGAKIYALQCAACHQADGAGIPPNFPPLWGTESFNSGAGMSHAAKMAAFVQYNMPQTHPGSLTAQQAYDVSAYIDSQPRPKYDTRYNIY
jgi:thiosulfate dehydrogenase